MYSFRLSWVFGAIRPGCSRMADSLLFHRPFAHRKIRVAQKARQTLTFQRVPLGLGQPFLKKNRPIYTYLAISDTLPLRQPPVLGDWPRQPLPVRPTCTTH